MREILFRGKRKDNGKWFYGSYLFLNIPPHDWTGEEHGNPSETHFIIDEHDINYAVDPATVGQFTGLTDKNGKKIFDGDIARGYYGETEYQNEVLFVEEGFALRLNHHKYGCCAALSEIEDAEVIGNIYDNPELLYHDHH